MSSVNETATEILEPGTIARGLSGKALERHLSALTGWTLQESTFHRPITFADGAAARRTAVALAKRADMMHRAITLRFAGASLDIAFGAAGDGVTTDDTRFAKQLEACLGDTSLNS